MSDVSFDRQASINNGWRQCSLFNAASCPRIYASLPENHKNESYFYMVLSHPCSLLNANLTNEPNMEYIICEPIDRLDGNATFGKNPRLLHIEIDGNILKLQQKLRGFIFKSLISVEAPFIPSLNFKDESLITRWMSNRYITTALPDEFESRLSKAKPKLAKLFNSEIGKACKSVYITMNEFIEDLNDDEVYECSLVFLLSRESYENLVKEEDSDSKSFEDFLHKVTNIYESVDGITLKKSMYVAEHQLTIEQVESGRLKKWQFDYVSLAKGGDIPNFIS